MNDNKPLNGKKTVAHHRPYLHVYLQCTSKNLDPLGVSNFFSLSVKKIRKSFRIFRYSFHKQKTCSSCLILIKTFHWSTHSISKLNKNIRVWFKIRLLFEKKQCFSWNMVLLFNSVDYLSLYQRSTPSIFVKFTFQMMKYQILIMHSWKHYYFHGSFHQCINSFWCSIANLKNRKNMHLQ